MIIKVKLRDDSGGWALFDNAEEVRYDTTVQEFTDRVQYVAYLEDLTVGFDGDGFRFIGNEIAVAQMSDEEPFRCSVVAYIRGGKGHCVVFDTKAYLMNDQGRTIVGILVSI
jgi:hypothetical protein